MEIEFIEEGSIKIILKGIILKDSNQGLNQIKELFLSDEIADDPAVLEAVQEDFFFVDAVRFLTDLKKSKDRGKISTCSTN